MKKKSILGVSCKHMVVNSSRKLVPEEETNKCSFYISLVLHKGIQLYITSQACHLQRLCNLATCIIAEMGHLYNISDHERNISCV